ncbi:hypothetical protein AB0K86_05970 [Streptomyces clavifer]|uniref:hypothetical protein n=1 Tax=Streptomyces clavifer TaxID=68188 RepID=UPI00343430C3
MTHGNDRAAHERAGEALSWLDAVWPCELPCFVVVDLDDYARAHGITHPDERTGLKEHIHEVRGGRIGPWAEPSEYTRRRRGLRCLRLREP